MSLTVRITPVIVSIAVWLSGCADTPMEATYYPDADADATIFWPKPPEVPRYRYAGQLVGEANFRSRDKSQQTAGTRFLRWVVGLGSGGRRRPDTLLRPQSGTVAPDGTIYVTDAGRGAVFVFDMMLHKLHVWDQADGGEAFESPIGISRTTEGELLVADAGLGRIVRLSEQGRPLGSFGEGVLDRPTGLVVSAELTFVADASNHDLKVFDPAGRLVDRIGLRGSAPGEFNGPTHLALAEDRLYVSDTLNARIQVMTTSGDPLQIVGSRGLYVGNLTRPKGVAVDSDGHIYVVESYYDHLVIFDEQGRYLLPIGGTGSEVGHYYLPAGAWTDDRDRIFVADMYNGRVLILQYLGE